MMRGGFIKYMMLLVMKIITLISLVILINLDIEDIIMMSKQDGIFNITWGVQYVQSKIHKIL